MQRKATTTHAPVGLSKWLKFSLLALACLLTLPAQAQEDPEAASATAEEDEPQEPAKRWSDSAELSYVILAGNSEASTAGIKNTYKWSDTISTVTLKANGIRTQSEQRDERRAKGTSDNFRVIEGSKEVTAENYEAEGRYDHKLSQRLFWYTSASWERDRFKGIDDRYVGAGGLGNLWVDTKRATFRTEYAGTFTREEEIADDPETDDSFAGARLSSELVVRFGHSSTYTNELAFDANLEESSDWRTKMTNALSVTINDRLKLKVSLEWRFDNEPSSEELDLVDDAGTPTGETVLAELDELDTIFTTSLVFDF